MGCPVYKSSSTPPDETTNPTPPSTSQPPTPSRTIEHPRTSSHSHTRRRLRRRRLTTRRIPAEFLSSSYSTASRSPRTLETQSKDQRLVLVLTVDNSSNRRKGTYKMSLTAYSEKMGFSIPHTILVDLSSPTRTTPPYTPFSPAEVPIEDPGFTSDNESTTSEDSILSDPEWISSNRELAMELLLGSSEDEFLGSLLGTDSMDEPFDTLSDRTQDANSSRVMMYADDDMDLEMADANNEHDDEPELERENGNTGSRYVREVDEDYD